MQREIKFRVWDKISKSMVRDAQCYLSVNKDGSLNSKGLRGENPVMQYTDHLDKHKSEIYEGDIVSDGTTIYLVKWDRNNTRFVIDPIISAYREDWALAVLNFQTLGNGYFSRKDLEIIGNIFENPEYQTNQP